MKNSNSFYTIMVVIVAFILLAIFIGAIVFAAMPSFRVNDYEVKQISVDHGESMYTLALRNKAPNCDWREWVYEVEKLNGINSDLRAGQIINIYSYIDK